MPISKLTSPPFDEELDYFVVAVKAGGPEGRGVCLCGWVDIGAPLDQKANYFCVSGGGRAPEGWRALYRLAVEGDAAGLLHVGTTPLHQIFNHFFVTVPAGEHQWGSTIGLGRHQLGHLVAGSVVKKDLERSKKK